MVNSRLEQLMQITKVTWDGNLISKTDRDELIKVGYCDKCDGLNYITYEGIKALIKIGSLKT